MNKNKKLILFSSISIVLMVALIGGSLAWFYLNEEVSVSYGNSIFCEAGDSLEIALVENGAATRWSSLIDYSAGEYTTVDISGDGYHLYRPAEINEEQQPISFKTAVSSLEDLNAYDYIEMEVAFRSLSKMKVFLSEDSFIEPVNTESDGTNIYGDFSRDYIAGAMRVAVIEGSELKMVWAPNSQYELIQYPNGTFGFRSGENGNSTPETDYSYFVEDENGEYVEQTVSADDFAGKKFVVDSTGSRKGFSGNSAPLLTLNPSGTGDYDQKTVKIRIWFEGTDREAHQALAGGNVNVKLKFVGIYKDEPEADKQSAIDGIMLNEETMKFSGLAAGMVFSTDGRSWKEYNPSAPNLPSLESGASIYFKYPETNSNYETAYKKFTITD